MYEPDNEGDDLPDRSVEEWLSLTKAQERDGELFRAYDLALQGIRQHPDEVSLKHRAVLNLASTGATQQAKAKYLQLGLMSLGPEMLSALPRGLVMDIATLWARIVKDEALLNSTGEARRAKLTEAGDLYEAAYREEVVAKNSGAYYPAINAATLRLLAADTPAAERLARTTLALIEAFPVAERGYYEFVSSVEAHLVLGEIEQAKADAKIARAKMNLVSVADFRGLASTLRQLRRVIEAKGLDGSWLEEDIGLPGVIHYVGHIISRPGGNGRFPAEEEEQVLQKIEAAFDVSKIGFGYGSLAAGADILFAEALLRRGAILNVVLPFDEEEFIDVSVRPAGPKWVERYRTCRARAATVRFATEDRYLGEDRLFAYCSQLAIGLAILRARSLSTEVEQIAVWDGQPSSGPAGTAADLATWERTGKRQRIISCGSGKALQTAGPGDDAVPEGRRTRAMLFGDVKGFSMLGDEELPWFTKVVLGAFARVIDSYGEDVLLVNTWGDGLFLVFDDAGKAAACALDLQNEMAGIDLAAAGLPPHIALRLGGHLGPVYTEYDPILKHQNFFGAHVSRTARIEPVTPEGCVYVTETLAAVLAIHNADRFACDYVGFTDMAKHYGRLRMFLLRRIAT